MRLFPKELEISLEDGFSPEIDIFGRKDFGDKLTRIVRGIETPLVMFIDAPWGTGKTVFVKMWTGELRKAGIPSIYFDAFAHDYQDDAFVSISSEMLAEVKRWAPDSSSARREFRDKAVGVAKVLGKSALRVGIKAATAGIVEVEDFGKVATEVTKAVAEELSRGLDDILKSKLESNSSDAQAFGSFRKALTELSQSISRQMAQTSPKNEKTVETDSRAPLVFIIDELDRCRPAFALEIIEKIKHFFSVEGVVFVLVSSFGHLELSVKFAYGNIDAHMYLEKFYHLRIYFPVERDNTRNAITPTFLRHLGCHSNLVDIIDQYCRCNPMSLRTLERLITYVKIARVSVPKDGLLIDNIIVVLIILKVQHPKQYEEMRVTGLSIQALIQLLRFDLWRSHYNSLEQTPASQRIASMWDFLLGSSEDDGRSGGLLNELTNRGLDKRGVINYHCALIDGYSFPEG